MEPVTRLTIEDLRVGLVRTVLRVERGGRERRD